MLIFKVLHSRKELPENLTQKDIVDFLYTHLERFRDTSSAISKAIDYAFSNEPGKGGFVILANTGDKLCGVLVMIKTGMEEFIPENILVYLAVHSAIRNRGIGSELLEKALEIVKGDIALHVEYDNPARHLYERFGFTSKYAEMRWQKQY